MVAIVISVTIGVEPLRVHERLLRGIGELLLLGSVIEDPRPVLAPMIAELGVWRHRINVVPEYLQQLL